MGRWYLVFLGVRLNTLSFCGLIQGSLYRQVVHTRASKKPPHPLLYMGFIEGLEVFFVATV